MRTDLIKSSIFKRVVTGGLAVAMTLSIAFAGVSSGNGDAGIFSGTVISASATAGQSDTDAAETELKTNLCQGAVGTSGNKCNVAANTYKLEGGGTVKYTELIDSTDAGETKGYINEAQFNKLRGSEKSKFLGDMNNVANVTIDNSKLVTEDTRTTWLNNVQNCNGVGTQLMTALLQNTKPDYATANKIYKPFSGVVSTALGLGAILIMAALGIVMVLDLSYIGIPLFRGFCDGGDSGNGQGGGGAKGKLVSFEAHSAVQEAEGGQGGGGQSGGSKKTAVAIYFKKRVIMLIVLGICLLYLIQGQIFTLVSWILDLMSGFLGF